MYNLLIKNQKLTFVKQKTFLEFSEVAKSQKERALEDLKNYNSV